MINIVDNDQNVRDGYMMLLKSSGFECNCYESSEEFIKNFHSEGIDLLLLDIHLNGLNGFTILEYLKKNGLHLPTIIITSFDDHENRMLAKNYGVIAYLRKPIDSEALIRYN